MRSTASKPTFHSVVDLGLRDVGVRGDPRALAARVGKMVVALFALALLWVVATVTVARATGVGAWVGIPLTLGWMVALFWLMLRSARRSPVMVVKVNAQGTNQAAWVVHAPFVLVVLTALMTRDLVLVPVLVLMTVMVVLVLRGRGRVPEAVRKLRSLLEADESVVGDGVGMLRGARNWSETLRLVVATDRRLLVATSARAERFLLLDVPYARVSRFGIEWRHRGRIGVLSLTAGCGDGEPPETHVISSIAPANLVSIARALHSHGVPADDPAAVSEAEHAWEEARRRGERRAGEPQRRLFDRAAMGTREFNRGLWLFLGMSAFALYLNPFGVGLGAQRDAAPLLLVIPAICAVCGYVSRSESSLAYLVPFNLFVSPAFFFTDASVMITLMLVLSAGAAAGLWAGWALSKGRVRAPAGEAASTAAPGSVRQVLSPLGLIQITGMLLGLVVALVAVAGAAGFELPTLRLAIDELTLKQVPVDGRSNLTGDAASLTYTPGPDLHEFITDEHLHSGLNDGARWELRSSWTKGYNVVSLANYAFEPRLDNAAAVAAFVAREDRQHDRLAGFHVTHTERVVDGRRGYVWNHGSRNGYWYYAAWFPGPVHSVRIECIAKRQQARFKRLCAEALGSLEFHQHRL